MQVFLHRLFTFRGFLLYSLLKVLIMETLGNAYYHTGLREAREGHYEKAFDAYSLAFLIRRGETCPTLEFISFYRYQLLSYLKGKCSFILSLPEGDMITDLIEDEYRSFVESMSSSPFCITGDGRRNLLESVKIVFPCLFDTEGGENAL